jgi:hypothetical protein
MPEVLMCPSCQRKLHVPETLMGQDVQCPSCAATFRAQGVGVTVPSAPLQKQDEPSPSRALTQPETGDRIEEDDRDDDYRDQSSVGRRRRRDCEPHRGGLILGLGIASLCVLGLGSIGVVIGLILGPMAWIMGSTDMAAIRSGRMDPDGEGQTNAGRICGMIATIIHSLALVLIVGVCIFFFTVVMAGSSGR